jgi:protein Mpv17
MIGYFIILSLCNCISSFHMVHTRMNVPHQVSRSFTSTSSVYGLGNMPTSIANAGTFATSIRNTDYITSTRQTSLQQSTKTEVEVEVAIEPKIDIEMESDHLKLEAATKASSQTETTETRLIRKVLNACLLAICFGFVTYSILNVDSGMTRGWSIPEKAMRIPLDNWSSYESSLNTQPIATKTMINVIIYLLGDWLSQTIFVKKNVLEFDALRTLRNGLIGLVFGPLVHEYYEFSDYILPVEVGWNRLFKILMDQTLYLSVKCSVYIVAVNVLAGESFEFSVDTAKNKIKDVMITAWKFWPLVHCITYGAIPARHRILWVNCVDLFWNAILALKTSGDDENEEDENGSEEGGIIVGTNGDPSGITKEIEVQLVNGIEKDAMEEISEIITNNIYEKEKSEPMLALERDISEKALDSISHSNETVVVKE